MKKIISLFMCIVLLISALCACSFNQSKNIVFLEKLIQCNITESGDKFGFNMLYLYDGDKPNVEFISFDNQNANAMFEEMIDDTFDSISDKAYSGYKAVILGFVLDTSAMTVGSELKINSIMLSVNGNEKVLDTNGQISVKKVSSTDEQYYCNSIYSTNVPVVIFSQCKNIESASFNYHTENAVTLDKFEFSDFMQIKDSSVYVDNQRIGSIDEVFPLTVGADKAVCIEISADFGNYDTFSDFYLNSLLHYSSAEDGTKILKDYFAIQAVGNFNDLSNLIDHVNPQ